MKWFSNQIGRKALKGVEGELTAIDKTVLKKCKEGANILVIIRSCKPYVNSQGGKKFATTEMVTASIQKLEGLKLLVRR